uniref:Uncharacterized protein n=1 Tax=Caenorhabditis japonica TaxID=281687 RepID=A0A8R1I7F7_CAEJA
MSFVTSYHHCELPSPGDAHYKKSSDSFLGRPKHVCCSQEGYQKSEKLVLVPKVGRMTEVILTADTTTTTTNNIVGPLKWTNALR